MAGHPARECRCQVAARVVGRPFAGVDQLVGLVGATPGKHRVALAKVAQPGDGPHAVVLALHVPGHDTGVKRGVVHRKKQLHVLVDAVAVTLRHMLGKQAPVAGWQLGRRAIGPVFDDEFLLRVQPAADTQDLLQIGPVEARALQIAWASGGSRLVVKLGGGCQRKRLDPLPVRCHKTLHHAQVVGQWLPTVGVAHVEVAQPGNAGQAKRHRPVVGQVAGVVGVSAGGQVTVLVGAVVAPAGDHGGGRGIANALWRAQAGAGIGGIKALAGHHRLQAQCTGREQIEQAAVGRVADGACLVARRVLGHRPARQRHHSPQRAGVVGGPGVIHAGVGNGQGTRHHRWRQAAQPHLGQGGRVPGGHNGRGGGAGARPGGAGLRGQGGQRQADGGLHKQGRQSVSSSNPSSAAVVLRTHDGH